MRASMPSVRPVGRERQPKSRPQNEVLRAASLSATVQEQRSLFGTPRRTSFLCWPQPAHVAFLQIRQVT